MRRPGAAGAATLLAALAACGGRPPGSVDLTSLLVAREDQSRQRNSAASPLSDALAEDTCLAADLAHAEADRAAPDRAQALADFAAEAEVLCLAGVTAVQGASDEFGNPVVRPPSSGVLRGEDVVFVWDAPSGTSLTQIRAVPGDSPICEGQGDDDVDAVIHPMLDGTISIEVEPSIELLAVSRTGQELCLDPERGVLTLSSAGAPWHLFAGTLDEAVDASVYVTRRTGGIGGFVWIPGNLASFTLPVGPHDRAAWEMSSSCVGHIGAEPDLRFTVLDADYGYVEVAAERDTVLVVRGPYGNVWCNDDTVGLNPALDLWLDAGEYELWVGTYSSGIGTEAVVTFY